jgi:hypothetical protein
VAPLHHDRLGAHTERVQRSVDLGPPPGGGDAVGDALSSEVPKEVRRSGENGAVRQELTEQLAVPPLHRLDLFRVEVPPHLPGYRPGEQTAAHPDLPMDPPPLDREARLGQGTVPREDVRVHRIDQGSVEIEDQAAHETSIAAVLRPTGSLPMERLPRSPAGGSPYL